MGATLNGNLNLILSYKSDIKSAIEAKGVDMTGLSFPDYPGAIASISTAFVTETLSVTSNGVYTPGEGVDGFSEVSVNVPQSVTGYTQKDVTEANYRIVNLNNSASYVRGWAFYDDGYLNTVDLPNCTEVGRSWTDQKSAFGACYHLTTVNLPICTFINDRAFDYCEVLSYISLPLCEEIGAQVFQWCYSLSSLVLPVCRSIGEYCFSGCSDIALTLGSTSVCSAGTRIFNAVTGTVSVYVPASLVDTYKSAPNWSQYSSQIFAIPEP